MLTSFSSTLLWLLGNASCSSIMAFVMPVPRIIIPKRPLSVSNEKDNESNGSTLFNMQRQFENLLASPTNATNTGTDSSSSSTTPDSSSLLSSSKEEESNNNVDWLSNPGRASLLLLSSALSPATDFLNEFTDGWALSYADLRPESEETLIGQSFLATNIAYAAVGLLLTSQGEALLGFMTEVVSVASFWYHYTQLQQPYNRTDDTTVKLALMVDYIVAVLSIMIGFVYLIIDQTFPSMEIFATSTIGITCLLACWVWEKGYPYIVLHSFWHIFSALTAYLIGQSHLNIAA